MSRRCPLRDGDEGPSGLWPPAWRHSGPCPAGAGLPVVSAQLQAGRCWHEAGTPGTRDTQGPAGRLQAPGDRRRVRSSRCCSLGHCRPSELGPALPAGPLPSLPPERPLECPQHPLRGLPVSAVLGAALQPHSGARKTRPRGSPRSPAGARTPRKPDDVLAGSFPDLSGPCRPPCGRAWPVTDAALSPLPPAGCAVPVMCADRAAEGGRSSGRPTGTRGISPTSGAAVALAASPARCPCSQVVAGEWLAGTSPPAPQASAHTSCPQRLLPVGPGTGQPVHQPRSDLPSLPGPPCVPRSAVRLFGAAPTAPGSPANLTPPPLPSRSHTVPSVTRLSLQGQVVRDMPR